MTDTTTDPSTKCTPAALPAALRERVLRAMQEAGHEAREEHDLECTLARLQPAPLPAGMHARLHGQMQQARHSTGLRPYSSSVVWRKAAAACVTLLGVFGLGATVQGMLGTGEAQGLARRSVLERTGGETVQWGEDGDPVREYEVMYEDSFVLPEEDDTTLVIRVPNRTIVSVKGEVI